MYEMVINYILVIYFGMRLIFVDTQIGEIDYIFIFIIYFICYKVKKQK